MSKQLSERLNFLKDQLFNSFFERKIWWGDDLSIFDSGEEGLEKLPMTMRKALAFEKVCNEMPIQILDRELIVGTTTMSSVGFGHTFPKYETDEEAEEFAKITLDRKSVWGHHLPYYCNRSVVQNGSAALDIQPRRHYVVNKVAAGQAYCRCKYILLYLHLKWGLHRIWDCPFFEIDPADSNSKRVIR